MTFTEGQVVIYSRARSGAQKAKDFFGKYICQCEPWGNGRVMHKIVCKTNGDRREFHVGIHSLSPLPPDSYGLCFWCEERLGTDLRCTESDEFAICDECDKEFPADTRRDRDGANDCVENENK